MVLKKIQIKEMFDENQLKSRLRKVRLKGFPDVRIYEDANISIRPFTPQKIKQNIFTPQPTVYRRGYLDRVETMEKLFQDKEIDPFNLKGGIDYVAVDENGEETEWTLIPPVIEMIPVVFDGLGLNYSELLSPELREKIKAEGHRLNADVRELAYNEYIMGMQTIPLICDGSHRIHSNLEKGVTQNLLVIDGPKKGFPYYAAPKPYSEVHVEDERPKGGGKDKIHVLTEPGHKLLYRLFPTGGILSGTVRPGKK